MTKVLEPEVAVAGYITLHLRPVIEMTDDQFFEFCQLNRDLRIEQTADGDLIIMPPTDLETGSRNFNLTGTFGIWAKQNGTGVGVGSSTGFALPNGAVRSPDVAWVRRSRLAKLTKEQKEKFIPLCPDFVVELRSATNRLEGLKEKMREYIANGAQLGWLLDPVSRSVFMYRADGSVERLSDPEVLNGDPLLPGFVLELKEVWDVEL